MNKITYKEFEREINEAGYHMGPEWKHFVCVANDDERTIATVSKTDCKILALDWPGFKELADSEKELMGDLCWRLANTPLGDREV